MEYMESQMQARYDAYDDLQRELFGSEPPSWATDPFNPGYVARCGDCNAWLEVVRPGKHQCINDQCPTGERLDSN